MVVGELLVVVLVFSAGAVGIAFHPHSVVPIAPRCCMVTALERSILMSAGIAQ